MGIAIHYYQDTSNAIVPGRIWPYISQPPFTARRSPLDDDGYQDTPWLPLLLPFLEQQPLANSFIYSLGSYGPGNLGFFANSTVTATRLGVLQCPSDGPSTPFQFPGSFLGGALSASIRAYPVFVSSNSRYLRGFDFVESGFKSLSMRLTEQISSMASLECS